MNHCDFDSQFIDDLTEKESGLDIGSKLVYDSLSVQEIRRNSNSSLPSPQRCCGFGHLKNNYRYVDCMVHTYYMGVVPVKIKVHVDSVSNSSNLHLVDVDNIQLESCYNNTIIKVLDITQHHLNPDVVYPMSYLVSLPAISSNSKEKNYAHDILFNVYNYLHFLNKNNIEFSYSTLIILSGIPGLDNAFWNGYYLSFGAGSQGNPLTSSLIVAHELTHALIDKTCKLEYQGLSGALNESFADIFGVCFEFYVYEQFPSLGWKIGSECGLLLRDMEHPWRCNQPVRQGDQYYMDPSSYHDNGGVHINSGIPNHVFYCVQDVIGWKNAFSLFARCFFKLTRYSSFKDFSSTLIMINRYLNLVPHEVLKNIVDSHFT